MTGRSRLLRCACLLAAGLAAGCASSGRQPVPRPFPTPGPPASPGALVPANARELVDAALKLVGTPYRDGGSTPAGFDCSGFVQYVFAQEGVRLPRTVGELAETGAPVEAARIRAGDLLFFTTTAPGPTHVAIALGDGRFVHAPSSRGVVRVDGFVGSYWPPRFLFSRRVIR